MKYLLIGTFLFLEDFLNFNENLEINLNITTHI